MPSMDRISFDTGVSAQVQSDIAGLVSQIESLIAQRNAQVSAAMADFQADGVSEEYHSVEQRWHRAATETQQIVNLVKQTLGLDDESATAAQGRARTAVLNIG